MNPHYAPQQPLFLQPPNVKYDRSPWPALAFAFFFLFFPRKNGLDSALATPLLSGEELARDPSGISFSPRFLAFRSQKRALVQLPFPPPPSPSLKRRKIE